MLGDGLGDKLGEVTRLGDIFPLGLTALTDRGLTLTMYPEVLTIGDGLSIAFLNDNGIELINADGMAIATEGLPLGILVDGDSDHALHRAGFLANASANSCPLYPKASANLLATSPPL